MALVDILGEIRKEREYQQNKFGDEFDEKHSTSDWLSFIMGYAGRAYSFKPDPENFRKMLVKTATLCVAAVEWVDRTNGRLPKRHWDKEE